MAKEKTRLCKFCNNDFELTRSDKYFCNRTCRNKYYWVNNKERKRKLYKDWVENNKEYRSNYMKEYKSTDEYRLMKKQHDKIYRLKHGNKPYNPTPELSFKKSCRAYADKHMKKEECCLCKSKDKLENHHDKYIKDSLEGVRVLCKMCHLEVVHGRGHRCLK